MTKKNQKNSPKDNRPFDQYLKTDEKPESVDESLSEIYEGADGNLVNLQEMNIKRQRNIWLRFGLALVYLAIAAGLIGGAYYWFVNRGKDVTALDFKITAPQNLQANQEFTYTLDYRNQENSVLSNMELVVVYPENFIVSNSFPSQSEGNNKWHLEDLKPFSSGQVKITGKMIAKPGESNLIFADLSYRPTGITSTFKKTASTDAVLTASGIDIEAQAPGSVLVGAEESISVTYKPQAQNYIDAFSVRLTGPDYLQVLPGDKPAGVTSDEPGVWKVNPAEASDKPLLTRFKFTDKKNETEEIKLVFEYTDQASGRSLVFDEKTFSLEVIKNSLNLTMTANGQSADQGVDFGQTVNYSISYANKGSQTMNNVIIMAVVDGDAVDWRKFADANGGKVSGSTVMWTKNEIPALKSVVKNQEGTIEFSVPVRVLGEAALIDTFEINSYAQFSFDDKPIDLSNENDVNRSNQLSLKVNSDAALDESVRYFDQDNIAVGTGPLPPSSGDTTTVKVYWTIKNSLHEIGGVKVSTTLPPNVTWDGKDQVTTGSLSYNADTHEVVWDAGRLPLSVSTASAEFSIAVKPRLSDRNKVMVLVSGTTLTATDSQTGFELKQTLKAQTTRLEKDDIADTDGIVK